MLWKCNNNVRILMTSILLDTKWLSEVTNLLNLLSCEQMWCSRHCVGLVHRAPWAWFPPRAEKKSILYTVTIGLFIPILFSHGDDKRGEVFSSWGWQCVMHPSLGAVYILCYITSYASELVFLMMDKWTHVCRPFRIIAAVLSSWLSLLLTSLHWFHFFPFPPAGQEFLLSSRAAPCYLSIWWFQKQVTKKNLQEK